MSTTGCEVHCVNAIAADLNVAGLPSCTRCNDEVFKRAAKAHEEVMVVRVDDASSSRLVWMHADGALRCDEPPRLCVVTVGGEGCTTDQIQDPGLWRECRSKALRVFGVAGR